MRYTFVVFKADRVGYLISTSVGTITTQKNGWIHDKENDNCRYQTETRTCRQTRKITVSEAKTGAHSPQPVCHLGDLSFSVMKGMEMSARI